MNKFALAIILSFSFLVSIHAQVMIKGCVKNKQNENLPFCSVMFYCADSLVAGTTTEKGGCFELKLDSGFYVMSISHVSYCEFVDSFKLKDREKSWDIVLEDKSYELDEAIVAVDRIEYESNINKDVFNVPTRVKNAAFDVYHVLQRIPMLKVDVIEKTVAMLGVENNIVMVNNVRRDNSYLQTLKPDEIDKVEIINNPGARYTSKNIHGIINIITKDEKKGHRASLFGQINPSLIFHSVGGSYNYLSDKTRVSVSGSYFTFDKDKDQGNMFREIMVNNDRYITEKKGENNSSNSLYSNLGINYEYILTDKSFFNISLNGNYSPDKGYERYLGKSYVNDVETKDFTNIKEYSTKSITGSATAYYQTYFDSKEHLLSIEATYRTNDRNRFDSYADLSNEVEYWNIQKQDNEQNSIDFQTDYTHPLSWTTLETGYRLYHQINRFNQKTNGAIDNMNYGEWRNFLYLQGRGVIGTKMSYQIGLGFDVVQTSVNAQKNNFYELMPNAMLRYKFNNIHNVRLEFNRARSSPAFSLLNPIERYTDSLRVTYGNPSLTPYYSNKISAVYTFYKNGVYISPIIGYNFTNNFITEIERLDTQGVYRTTYANASHHASTYFSLELSVKLTNWWELGGYGDIRRQKYKDNTNNIDKSFWEKLFYLNSNMNYKQFSLNASYVTSLKQPTLTGYVKRYPESRVFLGWQPKKNLGVQLGIRYLFPATTIYETDNTGYKERWEYKERDRYLMFMIGINYTFQKGKTNQSKPNKHNLRKFDQTIDKKSKESL